jgi:hypothetical protein
VARSSGTSSRARGGVFGSGDGEEMTGEPIPQAGSYRAVRWPIAALSTIELRPAERALMVVRAATSGWPAEAAELAD